MFQMLCCSRSVLFQKSRVSRTGNALMSSGSKKAFPAGFPSTLYCDFIFPTGSIILFPPLWVHVLFACLKSLVTFRRRLSKCAFYHLAPFCGIVSFNWQLFSYEEVITLCRKSAVLIHPPFHIFLESWPSDLTNSCRSPKQFLLG